MKKTLIISTFELIMLFFAMSFTEASFDIKLWNVETRCMYVFYAIAIIVFNLAIGHDFNKKR